MGVGQVGQPTKLAIFDRDGTLIDVVRDEETGTIVTAFHPRHIRFLDGALEGMRLLRDGGFLLAVATNQPGPAKGQCSAEAVEATNGALVHRLAKEGLVLSSLQVCMHHPQGGEGGDGTLVGPCPCRKPKAGMLEAALRHAGADAATSWMIGDTRSDVDAARAAGMRAALVFGENRCELCPLRDGLPRDGMPDVLGASLVVIAEKVLGSLSSRSQR